MPINSNLKLLFSLISVVAISILIIFFFAFFIIILLPLIVLIYVFRKKIFKMFVFYSTNKEYSFKNNNSNKTNNINNFIDVKYEEKKEDEIKN